MRIREIRVQKGVQQKELATSLGIAANTLSQYETGKREPDIKTMEKIADVLNVTVDDLLGRDEKKPAPTDGDGLSQEQLELIRLFGKASSEIQAAALAVLRSAEGQDKAQDGASAAK